MKTIIIISNENRCLNHESIALFLNQSYYDKHEFIINISSKVYSKSLFENLLNTQDFVVIERMTCGYTTCHRV